MATMPMKPPTGIGTGSVIQSTTTPSSTAASVCWDVVEVEREEVEDGRHQRARATGPSVRRRRLESLLGRRELLLGDAAVGRAAQQGLLDVDLLEPERRRSFG